MVGRWLLRGLDSSKPKRACRRGRTYNRVKQENNMDIPRIFSPLAASHMPAYESNIIVFIVASSMHHSNLCRVHN
jgi:hypothetical protein